MEKLSFDYEDNVRRLDDLLGVGRCCDLVNRDLRIGGRRARVWVVDGYGCDQILERMCALWLGLKPETVATMTRMEDFLSNHVSFLEANVAEDLEEITTAVLLGKTLLIIDGLRGGALIDVKNYPSRSVSEPADGKVLRGAHDGFVEALIPNLALLRRRIRDPKLTIKGLQAGEHSRTDIALCYLEDRADPELVEELHQKIQAISARSLSMGQESVMEAICPRQWYNPFPTVRCTERPDAAAACVLEGSVVVMVDNSPVAMIFPSSLFDFTQEANDFYFPPLVGTYLRLVRVVVFIMSLLITPVWYLLVSVPGRLPDWLSFLAYPQPCALSLFAQLLVVEFMIDVLKLASLSTPDALANSFSMLGALILGDFAVQASWLSPEVLVYMAFVSVAAFAQPSYELGYAFKLLRVVLLFLCYLFDMAGFVVGLLGILLMVATTKPVAGRGYLYPLIPFNAKAMRRLLFREPISRDNT